MLHSICQQVWKIHWPQDWKRSIFIPVPKKGKAKDSNYHTIARSSHASKVNLKILQARLEQCINWELPYVQAGFRQGRGARDQIINIHWIKEKAKELQENIYFCFIDYTKVFECVDHIKLWKILKEMGIPDHLTFETCMQVKKQQLELDMEQQTSTKLGKEYIKAVYCHLACLTYMPNTSCKMLG